MNLWEKWTSINPLVILFLQQIRIKAQGKNWCPPGYRIINHCKSKIHTGKLEGINNTIKAIKRKVYGYNHFQYLALKIIAATATDS